MASLGGGGALLLAEASRDCSQGGAWLDGNGGGSEGGGAVPG